MDHPFTDTERRFVLAEAIKLSSVSIDALLLFVETERIEPKWHDMALPIGRSVNACATDFNGLLAPTASASTALVLSKKRRYSGPEPSTARALQPRPAVANGSESPWRSSVALGSTGKKRGRPSKADLAARAADAVARGFDSNDPNIAIQASAARHSMSGPSPVQELFRGVDLSIEGGKKKRGRPSKAELLARQTSSARPTGATESTTIVSQVPTTYAIGQTNPATTTAVAAQPSAQGAHGGEDLDSQTSHQEQ